MTAQRVATLFVAHRFRAIELGGGDAVQRQRFFDENPEYFVVLTGQGPHAAEAEEEIDRLPPDGWPSRRNGSSGSSMKPIR
jgi:hypothetical protein